MSRKLRQLRQTLEVYASTAMVVIADIWENREGQVFLTVRGANQKIVNDFLESLRRRRIRVSTSDGGPLVARKVQGGNGKPAYEITVNIRG